MYTEELFLWREFMTGVKQGQSQSSDGTFKKFLGVRVVRREEGQ